MHSLSPLAAFARRDHIVILVCVLLLTALAWAYLIHLDGGTSSSLEYDEMMRRMGMPVDMPWTFTDIFFTFVMWTVMMVGMMAGTAIPVLVLFASARAARREQGVLPAVLMFGAGYFIVWMGFSACAALAQWALHEAALLSSAMKASSQLLAGMILIGTGIYQLTGVKGECLTHCRSPLGFLMTNWRDGSLGSFRMGSSHGTYCLGCCWALMCVLFVVGVMNLIWVAALTGFVLIEKIGPEGAVIARVAGVVLVVSGIWLIA